MKPSRIFIGISILLTVISASCAEKGPLLVDFQYNAPKTEGEAAPRLIVIGVSQFKDQREKGESIAGKRFVSLNDVTNDLVVQGTVSGNVTSAVKKAFKARGIEVRDAAAWDLTDKGIPAGDSGLLVGGEIKALWVESVSSLAKTNVKADVQLRILIADMAEKKIIRALNVSSTTERQHVRYSAPLVESTLSEALSVAVNQIFNEEELKKRLQ